MPRKVEIYSAGCPCCTRAVELVESLACDSCEIAVLDMNDPAVAARARAVGVERVPAVVVDGVLADCCAVSGPTEAGLRAAGIGSRTA